MFISKIIIATILFLGVVSTGVTGTIVADSGKIADGSVKAILFYTVNCQRCTTLLLPFLSELKSVHENRLQLLVVNNNNPSAGDLYLRALVSGVVEPDSKLPILMSGNRVLSGIDKIQSDFPDVIEEELMKGGTPWPPIDGFDEVLVHVRSGKQSESLYLLSANAGSLITVWMKQAARNYRKDIVGNSIATIILIAMVFVWVNALRTMASSRNRPIKGKRLWLSPILLAVGLVAAGYLLLSGISGGEPACGPVGDCQTVQESDYSKLFGIIPVSLLGVLSYLAIFFLWLFYTLSKKVLRHYAILAAWGIALVGIAFFIYLTFLEPFVIGASCAWCLTSAVAMSIQLWILNAPAKEAWAVIRQTKG